MDEYLVIREMDPDDIDIVANIHATELKNSFLGLLGNEFLKKLYDYMLQEPYFKCFVAECDSKLCAYISITLEPDKFYKNIYKKHLFSLATEIILKGIKNPKIIIQALQVFFSKTPTFLEKSTNKQKAELLSIATIKENRSKGIGTRIMKKTLSFLKKKGITYFFVIVDIKIEANRFYPSIGFLKKGVFKLHGNEMNFYLLVISDYEQ